MMKSHNLNYQFRELSANRQYREAVENDSLILLARIVDSAGVTVRPADVHRIEYSIYELDPCWTKLRTVVAGHNGVACDVEQIMFDSLQVANPWTIDCAGYNFRHEIRSDRGRAFPKAGMDYELRYQFISRYGEKTVVQFRITG